MGIQSHAYSCAASVTGPQQPEMHGHHCSGSNLAAQLQRLVVRQLALKPLEKEFFDIDFCRGLLKPFLSTLKRAKYLKLSLMNEALRLSSQILRAHRSMDH